MQKYKFEIWVLKLPFWTPEKAHFWFKKKKTKTNFFFMFRLWFSFINNRRTNVLSSVFLKTHWKKAISRQKCHFGRFWQLLTFFSALKKILTKTTFVRLLYLKLKQKEKIIKYLLKVFVSKFINVLFGVN